MSQVFIWIVASLKSFNSHSLMNFLFLVLFAMFSKRRSFHIHSYPFLSILKHIRSSCKLFKYKVLLGVFSCLLFPVQFNRKIHIWVGLANENMLIIVKPYSFSQHFDNVTFCVCVRLPEEHICFRRDMHNWWDTNNQVKWRHIHNNSKGLPKGSQETKSRNEWNENELNETKLKRNGIEKERELMVMNEGLFYTEKRHKWFHLFKEFLHRFAYFWFVNFKRVLNRLLPTF